MLCMHQVHAHCARGHRRLDRGGREVEPTNDTNSLHGLPAAAGSPGKKAKGGKRKKQEDSDDDQQDSDESASESEDAKPVKKKPAKRAPPKKPAAKKRKVRRAGWYSPGDTVHSCKRKVFCVIRKTNVLQHTSHYRGLAQHIAL
jgi:hypothetical protein